MIRDDVERFVDDCIADPQAGGDADFGRLALRVFAHQYERVEMYRRLCELRGASPRSVQHWSQVPAAPADLFKEDLGAAMDPAGAVFRSSGTTAGPERRSTHAVDARSLALYRRSSMAHFRRMVLPDGPGPMAVLLLGPGPATHPHSSLGHMYGFAIDEFAATRGGAEEPGQRDVLQAFDAEGNLDLQAATARLEEAARGSRPLLVLALSSTITAVFEHLRATGRALRLPADSRLVDTGGSKGGRVFSRAGILQAAWRFLHIPAYLCAGEYGMTELLSQFYDDTVRARWEGHSRPRAKQGPRWTRTLVVDPATLMPVDRGSRGILRHVDLANVGSIAAVQTLDVGVEEGAGFQVLGRAADAEARGCSQLMSVLSQETTRGEQS